jgi:hypothetical protein
VEGGGECDLDNIRTLCVWCHRVETTRLAQRRATSGGGGGRVRCPTAASPTAPAPERPRATPPTGPA